MLHKINQKFDKFKYLELVSKYYGEIFYVSKCNAFYLIVFSSTASYMKYKNFGQTKGFFWRKSVLISDIGIL